MKRKTFSEYFAKELFAEKLRVAPTRSEEILRNALITRGYEFDFQKIVYGYIPDFHFGPQKKILELDGKCHASQREYDKLRESHLRGYGYKILRIKSSRIFTDFDKVLLQIDQFIRGVPMQPKARKRFLKRERDAVRNQRVQAKLRRTLKPPF